MKDALLIIDVQNDYFPGGRCELHNVHEAEENIVLLVKESRAIQRPIIYLQHVNPSGAPFFVEGTSGVEILERIKPEADDKVIVKHYPNGFLKTELDAYLKEHGIEKLIVCGMMTHMCVDTTVRAAMDYGYKVDLAAGACTTRSLDFQGEIIPAETIQKVFIAALSKGFATIV